MRRTLALVLLVPLLARAADVKPGTVPSLGTPIMAVGPDGKVVFLAVDDLGRLITSGSGGTGGSGTGGDVNVTNSYIIVSPRAGQTWPVSQSTTPWNFKLSLSGSDVASGNPLPVYFPSTQTVSIGNWPTNFGINNWPTSFGMTSSQLPVALDADGGLPVHVVNQSAGGGGAVTQADPSQLQTTVTPAAGATFQVGGSVSVSNLPTTQETTSTQLPSSLDTGNLRVAVENSPSVSVLNFPATQPISGSVSISGTPSVSVSNFPSTQTVSSSQLPGALDADLGMKVHVQNPTSSVSVSNLPATQAVTGTFWQPTQPVSIDTMPSTPVTNSNLDVALSTLAKSSQLPTALDAGGGLTAHVDNFPATQTISGSVSATISGTPTVTVGNASIPVTGAFYQATQPVSIASMPSTPVTGTFWQTTQPVSGPITDTQLRASAVPVSLASAPTTAVTNENLDAALSTLATKTQLPTTLGAKTTANSMAVNIASDQTVPVSGNIGFTAPQHVIVDSGGVSNSSVGTNAATAPSSSTQMGWKDGSGNLQPISAANPLPVSASVTPPASVVSAVNSSTATLAGGGTFTGTSTSLLNYAGVEVQVFSNVASAANGVQIQFSPDGTNWNDSVVTSYTPGSAPNDGQVWSTGARGQYVRVVYTNGASAQAAFRLQTILLAAAAAGDSIDIAEMVSPNNHALITKSVIAGKTTAGGSSYVDVKVSPSGSVSVTPASEGTNGSAAPTTSMQVGGSDGTNLRPLKTDATGQLYIANPGGAAGATITDTFANPTAATPAQSFLMGWNGATWDRIRSESTNADADGPDTGGMLGVENYNMVFNGTNWDRQRGDTNGSWMQLKDRVATGTLSAACATPTATCVTANSAVVLDMSSQRSASITFSAFLNGTVAVDWSGDGGTTWAATYFDGSTGKTSTITNPAAGSMYSIVGSGGSGLVRVRVSAYTSGTTTATLRGSQTSDQSMLYTGPVSSSIAPPHIVRVGGITSTGVLKSVAIMAASTAPTTNEEAVVVAISPNSPMTEVPTTSASQALLNSLKVANTASNVKASAGNVYGLSCANANASICWLQFYNTAGSPTCGSGVIWSIPLPSSGTLTIPPSIFALANHSSGIGICMSTTSAGATACSTANSCTIFYK